jgi:transposase
MKVIKKEGVPVVGQSSAAKSKNAGGRPPAINQERLRELTGAGWKDSEIAVEFGVDRSAIAKARGKLGLLPTKKRGRPSNSKKAELDEAIMVQLVQMGYGPNQVARRFGCRRSKVIQAYRGAQPKTWPGLLAQLPQNEAAALERWMKLLPAVICHDPDLSAADFEQSAIAYLDLVRMEREILSLRVECGRAAYPDDAGDELEPDDGLLARRHHLHLLETQMFREMWRIMRGMLADFSPQARKCAEAYLCEEIQEPFFGVELPDVFWTPRIYLQAPPQLLDVQFIQAEPASVSGKPHRRRIEYWRG